MVKQRNTCQSIYIPLDRRCTREQRRHQRSLRILQRQRNSVSLGGSHERVRVRYYAVLVYFLQNYVVSRFSYFSGRYDIEFLEKETPLWKYNASRQSYEPCAPIPEARHRHQLVGGRRGTIYAIGGDVVTDSPNQLPSSKPCDVIHRYSADVDKWNVVSFKTETTLCDRQSEPCFSLRQYLIAVKKHGKIACIDIFKKSTKIIEVCDEKAKKALSCGTFCATQLKTKALLTEFRRERRDNSSVTFVMLDLERVVKDSCNKSSPDCSALVSSRSSTLAVSGRSCNVVAMSMCGHKVLALSYSIDGDIVVWNCDYEDLLVEKLLIWEMCCHRRGIDVGFEVLKVKDAKMLVVKTEIKRKNENEFDVA